MIFQINKSKIIIQLYIVGIFIFLLLDGVHTIPIFVVIAFPHFKFVVVGGGHKYSGYEIPLDFHDLYFGIYIKFNDVGY